VCAGCRGNASAEPLRSNGTEIREQTKSLVQGIDDPRFANGLRFHEMPSFIKMRSTTEKLAGEIGITDSMVIA
jgi:hypothetical protein